MIIHKLILAIFCLTIMPPVVWAKTSSKSKKHEHVGAIGKSVDTTPYINDENYNSQFTVEQDVYDSGFGTYYSPTISTTPINNQLGSLGISLSGQNISLTPSSPAVYLNVAVLLNITGNIGVSIGSMNGIYATRLTSQTVQEIQSFHYATMVFSLKELGLSFDIGPYYMNKQMSSIQDAQGNSYNMKGLTMGLGYTSKTWNLSTSYITGHSNIGGLNFDIGYNINRFQPYLGFGFATSPPTTDPNADPDADPSTWATVSLPVSWYWASGISVNF